VSEQDWCATPLQPPAPGQPGSTKLPEVQQAFSLSSLCSRGWQPVMLTGFLRNFLMDQWSSPVNIFNFDLQQFVWSQGPDSGILIESVTRFVPETVGKRPAILIKRNRMKFTEMGLGGRVQGVIDTPTEKGAITEHTSSVAGSHTLFCLHYTGMTAEMLATEVTSQVLEFSLPIRSKLDLQQFAVLEVGAVHKLREGADSFVVPITIGWTYEAAWRLKLQSLPLKTFQLELEH